MLVKLNDNGVKLISVLEQLNDTPESIILKSVLTGMNEYYSLNLSREVKKGLNENALKGIHNGGNPPLGYDLDKDRKYIINEKEAEAVRLIFHLANKGEGYAKIATYLNEHGYKNKLGKDFKKVSIRDTLLNIKYIGTYYHGLKNAKGKFQKNPIIIENNHSAIVNKEIFYKVQEHFKNSKKGPRSSDKNNYFLTGLMKCGECGGSYSGGYRSKNRDGSIHYGYQCRNRKDKVNDCKNKPIRKQLIEKYIYDIIKEEIFNENKIKKIVNDIYSLIIKRENQNKKNTLVEELKKYEKMSMKLLEKNLEGEILDNIFTEKNNELNKKIFILKNEIEKSKNAKHISKGEIEKYLYKMKKDSIESFKRDILELFLKEVIIYKEKIEIIIRPFPKKFMDMAKVGGSDGN